MSVFSADMTMHIWLAPAAIIRSTRYSETALGRSTPLTIREPTGSSSLEQPRGWIRSPAPAAGMIPIIALPLCSWMHSRRIALPRYIAEAAWRGHFRYVHRACVALHGPPWIAARRQRNGERLQHLPHWPPREVRSSDRRRNPVRPTCL